MSTPNARTAANRANARKSTGPRTAWGKAAVAGNALKHGLTARRVLLDSEDGAAFQALTDSLMDEFRPSGSLETALVERLAFGIWRQLRLQNAETAMIWLETTPAQILKSVRRNLGLESHELQEEDLEPEDPETLESYEALRRELASIDLIAACADLGRLEQDSPEVFRRLSAWAEDEGQTLAELLSSPDDIAEVWEELHRDYQRYFEKAPVRAQARAVAAQIRAAALGRVTFEREKLAKYQIQLDNELYKAMKMLREQIEWRMKTLDADVTPVADGLPSDP